MMRYFLYLLLSIFFISCQKKYDYTYYKPIISHKKVKLTKIKYPETKDSVSLLIPIEYALHPRTKSIRYYIHVDNKRLETVGEYVIYNGETDKLMLGSIGTEYPEPPKSIYFVVRNLYLSKSKAKELLDRYAQKESLEELFKGDTISLVPYAVFRQKEKAFIEGLRKEPDTIRFRIVTDYSKPGTEGVEVFREEIKW